MIQFFKSFSNLFFGKKRRTKINLSEVYNRGELADIPKAELRLILYLILNTNMKLGPRYKQGEERDIELDREIGIANQTEHLSYGNLKNDFRSESELGLAIKSLISKGILSKSPKRGYYYVNPNLINHNYSHQNDALMITDSSQYK